MGVLFTLRWSARDLRRRWLQVAAIALIIAIGTGVYTGLGSTATWRRQSNDASFERTAMYDLRVRAAAGADIAEGEMVAVLDSLADPGAVADAEERLVVPTQVDASRGDETILVPGRIVSTDVAGGPRVNRVHVADGDGRNLVAADVGRAVVVLERNFAAFYDLPADGSVQVGGRATVDYVGLGLAPEYFYVTTEEGGFFAQANFAAVFTSLQTAQDLAGRPGRVNDLVLRLRAGADASAVATDLEDAFDATTDLGVTVMETVDDDSYRILYDDIDGDQRVQQVMALLILAGATFAAFNLATRMVESQRREIGIGMALGQSPWELAARPLLVGAQIAGLGAVLGVGVGHLVALAIRPVFLSALPLPVWLTPFQPGLYARGALIGFALPFVATAWPVARAVRTTPVDAISTTNRAAKGGLAPLLRRLPWPKSAFRRMPVGNVLRTPRRTILTALGIGAAIATLVALLGMIDSLFGTMDRNDREALGSRPDRVVVTLDAPLAADDSALAAIVSSPTVGDVQPVYRAGARISGVDGAGIEALIDVLDLDNDVWTPTVDAGASSDTNGLLLARSAADDLGVGPGDTVTVQYAATAAGGGFTIATQDIVVRGTHPSPFRFYAYLDRDASPGLATGDTANELMVLPAAGATPDDVERALFGLDGVASVQPVAAAGELLRDTIEDFTAVFRAVQGFILLLAVLIAYNASSINADERAKDRATLFAFGLPIRRVIALETAEGLILGVLGTIAGIGTGLLMVRWMTTSILRTTLPELALDVVVTTSTLATALVLGVLAVAIAPLLTIRRLRRMDIPGTLRIVE